MDTISTEEQSSGSYLPIASLLLAGVSLLLALVALVKISDLRKMQASLNESAGRMVALESQLRSAVASVEAAAASNQATSNRMREFEAQTQRAFDDVKREFGTVRTSINRVDLAVRAVAERPVPVTAASTPAPAPPPAPDPAPIVTAPPVSAWPSASPASSGIADASPAAAGEERIYVVKAGDTLGRIAREHNLTLEAIEAVNPGMDRNRLQVGQRIRLPAE